MSRTGKYMGIVVLILLILFGFRWIGSGYHIIPDGAFKTSPVYRQAGTKLFSHLKYAWCNVYLVKEDSGYATVAVERKGLFWYLSSTWNLPQTSDKVNTVGWASFAEPNHQLSVLAVESNDSQVKWIQAGPPGHIQRKQVLDDTPVIFTWEDSGFLNSNFHPVALNNKGQELYYYGYPKDKNVTSVPFDYKWYPSS